MAYTKLAPHHTPDASVEEFSRGAEYRLIIPAGPADKYRLAQIDDYTQTPRSQFLCAPLLASAYRANLKWQHLWDMGIRIME